MTVASDVPIRRGIFTYRGHDFTILAYSLIGFVISLIVYFAAANAVRFPQWIIDGFPFVEKVNEIQTWMEVNLKDYTRAISEFVRIPLDWLEEVLWELPWLFVLLLFAIPSFAYGGLRLGLLAIVGVSFWGVVGMWYEAMSTLSLMAVSVALSVLLGLALGIFASQSDRFEAFLRPILDTMQTMPAFVYLIPAIFFFGIGAPSATLAIVIYALPPAVRLTSLGIRQVPSTTVEAAQSYGSTRWQMLSKVKLPLALPSIVLGINQTIMMALGLAVLAVFIGAGGLGEQVWKALVKLKVGWAFEAGICIVFMAIILDRLTYAISGQAKGAASHYGSGPRFHLLPQSWDESLIAIAIEKPIGFVWNLIGKIGLWITSLVAAIAGKVRAESGVWLMQRPFLVVGGVLLLFVLLFGGQIRWMSDFPSWLEVSFRASIDESIDWLTVNPTFIAITKFIRTTVFLYLLDPLDRFLAGLPWWYVMAALGLDCLGFNKLAVRIGDPCLPVFPRSNRLMGNFHVHACGYIGLRPDLPAIWGAVGNRCSLFEGYRFHSASHSGCNADFAGIRLPDTRFILFRRKQDDRRHCDRDIFHSACYQAYNAWVAAAAGRNR